MHTYFLSVGRPEIAVELMSLSEAQKRHLSKTPSERVRFVEPGSAFMVNANDCPVIIATAGLKMAVACAKSTTAVDRAVAAIIRALDRKVPHTRIEMCMQFGDVALELTFIEHVRRVRVWHAWTMFALHSYPPIARARKGAVGPEEWSLIRIRRDT